MHAIFEKNTDGRTQFSGAPENGKRKLTEKKAPPAPLSVNFAHGMVESSELKKPKRFVDFLISLLGQGTFVALLILLPLVYTQAFDVPQFEKTMLVIPPPPPPPPPSSNVRIVVKPKVSLFKEGKLIAPREIPKQVAILKEAPQESSAPAGIAGGVPGGVAGGALGGVLGGILTPGNVPLPPPKPQRSRGPLRVGGQIQAPRLVQEIRPAYPILAKETRTQGTVVLDCVIDEHGNVTRMKLVSGHPLLVNAAYQAVQQWKYQPTLLNGVPVAVEMEVTVNFSLSS